MGLSEILDIDETQQVGPQGELQRVYRVTFLTQETSGSKTVDIPAEDFTPELARQRAEQQAAEIDQAFTGGDG
jgi:hypothetical protein